MSELMCPHCGSDGHVSACPGVGLHHWKTSEALSDILRRLNLHLVIGVSSEEKMWQEIERVIAAEPPREDWTLIGPTYCSRDAEDGAVWFQHLLRLRR